MKKAFTLIELLIVIAILGSLSTFVIINFTGAQKRANDVKRKSELRQYQNGLEVFANSNNSVYTVVSPAAIADTICGTIGLSACVDDPNAANGWHYMYQSTSPVATDYVLWARMEKVQNAAVDEYFVLCSTGEAEVVIIEPSTGNCPL